MVAASSVLVGSRRVQNIGDMPSPASPDTNQFRCEACGRYFNSGEELKAHATECEGAKQSQVHKEHAVEPQYGQDREWKSTP